MIAAVYERIEKDIQNLPPQEISFEILDQNKSRDQRIKQVVDSQSKVLDAESTKRLYNEFFAEGPLVSLLDDESITELIITAHDQICFEKNGKLTQHDDKFFSQLTYNRFLEKICQEADVHFNLENPMINGKWRDFRLHIASSEVTQGETSLSLRRHPKSPWTFEKLMDQNWCTPQQYQEIEKILLNRKTFLVVGGTGSGKTSFLNACLKKIPAHERMVIIEDTQELSIPNSFSTRLLTRHDCNGQLPEIDQGELVRQSLRMRPDRLVMGEIRGSEAKDLLMALSTGHAGSFGSLHASTAAQALIRLEMLIQMGAPNWSLSAIRNLIRFSLDYIVVLNKNPAGQRQLQGLYQITSLEEMGLLLEKIL